MAERRIRAIVTGLVQGVGFRYHTREQGVALRLSGFVRNRADGSVELEAQGDTQALDAFIAWLREGPRHAEVSAVDIEEHLPRTGEDSFEIKR